MKECMGKPHQGELNYDEEIKSRETQYLSFE